MADNRLDLSFLGGIPEGLLTAEQQTAAQTRARQAAALQLGLGMIAGAQGQRGAGKPGLAQIVAQAGPGALQAYQGSFDKTLRDMLVGMQVSEARKKQQQQEQLQKLLPQVFQVQRGPATQEVIASEQGDDVLTREGPVTGVGINRQMLPALATVPGGLEVATNLAKFQETMYPKPEYLTVGESVYRKTPDGLTPVISSGGKFTGDFANYAIGIYGTADANKILEKDPNAFGKIEQGVLAKAKAGAASIPTGEERKAGFLANRVKFGLEQISDVLKTNAPAARPEVIPSVVKYLTGSDTFATNLTSAERQRIEAAQLDVLDAALTLGTGAAYTREQLEGYRRSYFPVLGEDPATTKDKQKRLQNLLESAYITAGRSAPTGPIPQIPEAPAAPAKTPSAGAPPAGITQQEWNAMTPAERSLWKTK